LLDPIRDCLADVLFPELAANYDPKRVLETCTLETLVDIKILMKKLMMLIYFLGDYKHLYCPSKGGNHIKRTYKKKHGYRKSTRNIRHKRNKSRKT
jgi:hypothetical protein